MTLSTPDRLDLHVYVFSNATPRPRCAREGIPTRWTKQLFLQVPSEPPQAFATQNRSRHVLRCTARRNRTLDVGHILCIVRNDGGHLPQSHSERRSGGFAKTELNQFRNALQDGREHSPILRSTTSTVGRATRCPPGPQPLTAARASRSATPVADRDALTRWISSDSRSG